VSLKQTVYINRGKSMTISRPLTSHPVSLGVNCWKILDPLLPPYQPWGGLI